MAIYGNIAFSNNIKYLINEAYVGKTPIIEKMIDQIGKIRLICRNFTDINKNKEVQALNRLFEEQFGMEVFSLHVIQEDQINAYTIPINTRFDVALKQDISKMVEGSKTTGYKFKKDSGLGIICCIYSALLMSPNYSDEEILAILFHELGHNFADAIYNKIKIANIQMTKEYYNWLIIDSILSLGIRLIPNLIEMNNNKNKSIVKKEKRKISNPLRGLMNGIKGKINNFGSFCGEVFTRLIGVNGFNLYKDTKEAKKEKEWIRSKSTGRQNEVIADLFCGVYGLGPAQVSALLKMNNEVSRAEKFVDKIPAIGRIRNEKFNDDTKDLCDFDVHPHVIQRANEEINMLKDELTKSNLDPKMEKVISDQIKEMQNMIKKASETIDKAQKSEVARSEFYKFINNNEPTAVTEEIENEIFKALDDALNKK